jgi:uncharacterized membrane protein
LSPLPAGLYELCVAPLAVSLAFIHARRALGSRRAAGELVALAAYGYALERAAIAAFAAHEYPPAWRVAPGGVPLAVVVVWAAVISSAMAVAVRRGAGSPPSRAVSAALLALLVDLAMEPVAVRAGLWRWTPPGAWLGVPVGNFVGWAVIVGSWPSGGRDRIAFGSRRVGAAPSPSCRWWPCWPSARPGAASPPRRGSRPRARGHCGER